MSFLIKDIDQNFCDFDQQKTLADTLKAEMQSAEMETLQPCPCGKNGFPLDNLVRFLMDQREVHMLGIAFVFFLTYLLLRAAS